MMEKLSFFKEARASPPLPPAPPVPENVKPVQIASPKRSLMKRPGAGTLGQPINLLSNHFRVMVKVPDAVFFQYSVAISLKDETVVEGKGIGRKIIDALYRTYASDLGGKRFAYDGEKALYTVGPLPQTKMTFTVVLDGPSARRDDGSPAGTSKRSRSSFGSKTYKVAICYASKIPFKSVFRVLQGVDEMDSNSQEALRVLDIVLRQQAASRGCLLVRQSFFHDDSRLYVDVKGGVSGLRGFHSSFRATQGGLSLNMDVSTTMVLTPGPVINFLLANQNVREPRDISWDRAKKVLKNLRVKPSHRNMEFKIIGLSENPCNRQYFPMRVKNNGTSEGETSEITVYDYFKQQHGIELTVSAYMPCLNVGKLKRPNYLPIELCSLVTLQRYTKSLSSIQRASLVEQSRQKPQDRIRSVSDAMSKYRYDDDPVLVACGISIEKRLNNVDGRVLETPRLKVGNNEDFIPNNGRWNFNRKRLIEPAKIKDWVIVNFSARCDPSHISRELINCGRNKGLVIERPSELFDEDQNLRRAGPLARADAMIEQVKVKVKMEAIKIPKFILCILPERKNSEIYGPWKKICLSNLGVPTQCISPGKVNDQYFTNLLLKINTKLGGKNSLLAIEYSSRIPLISDTPTLILGMDVSHGSPGRSDVPSIAAVVGSRRWPLVSRYRASVRTQSPKVEMIDALYKPSPDGKKDDGMIRELLMEFYYSSNHRKPSQIIIFRDGVSESQFNQVLNIELGQIIKAYQHLEEATGAEVDVLPKFTVIVAQKNQHTKLFLANGTANVPPGTVVDTKIVHPSHYDFFMNAHAGMIGTSRPAHYHVLYDEIGFKPDILQNLINSLSYVSQRSTTAISIVAPICYAHLAAYQVGQFMKFEDSSDTSSSGQRSMTAEGPSVVPELPRLHKAVAGSMFFC